MDVKDIIRTYIVEEICSLEVEFGDDESLYETNILNSLRIIQLITYIHEKFNIIIEPSDMTIEDFETVNNIAEFIGRIKADSRRDNV